MTVLSTSQKRFSMVPVIKWVGGKRSLMPTLDKYLSKRIRNINTFVEPFAGGMAATLWMKANYKNIKEFIVADSNYKLINFYRALQQNPMDLVNKLTFIALEYAALFDLQEKKEDYYYNIRDRYNEVVEKDGDRIKIELRGTKDYYHLELAAHFFFLNKAGFNGLFRESKKGKFNVPVGRQSKPMYVNDSLMHSFSEFIQDVTFKVASYNEIMDYYNGNRVLYYLDPPYLRENPKSFTRYTSDGFDENAQKILAEDVAKLLQTGTRVVISNSLVEGFDWGDLYPSMQIHIVENKRNVSATVSGRGIIKEVVLTSPIL